MRETASPGVAGRTARGTCKTSCLEEVAGIWAVALPSLPAPVLGAVFAYCLLVCGPVYPRNHTSYRTLQVNRAALGHRGSVSASF